MRKADHYGSIARSKRQKNRAKNQKSNAKMREEAITQIDAYRKRRARECHFLSNEDIAQRIGLNIATCKAIGVFNRMHDRLPKLAPNIFLVIGPTQPPSTIFDFRDFKDPFEGMMPLFLLAGVGAKISRKNAT